MAWITLGFCNLLHKKNHLPVPLVYKREPTDDLLFAYSFYIHCLRKKSKKLSRLYIQNTTYYINVITTLLCNIA